MTRYALVALTLAACDIEEPAPTEATTPVEVAAQPDQPWLTLKPEVQGIPDCALTLPESQIVLKDSHHEYRCAIDLPIGSVYTARFCVAGVDGFWDCLPADIVGEYRYYNEGVMTVVLPDGDCGTSYEGAGRAVEFTWASPE